MMYFSVLIETVSWACESNDLIFSCGVPQSFLSKTDIGRILSQGLQPISRRRHRGIPGTGCRQAIAVQTCSGRMKRACPLVLQTLKPRNVTPNEFGRLLVLPHSWWNYEQGHFRKENKALKGLLHLRVILV